MKRKLFTLVAAMAVITLGLNQVVHAEDGHDHGPVAKEGNKVCPMTGEENGKDSITVEHRGKTVTLCCKMCGGDWKKLTDKQRDAKLAKMGSTKIEVEGATTTKSGPYVFATCVVSGKKLGGMGDVVTKNFNGREVRLCCKGCVGKFTKSPDKYNAKLDKMILEDQGSRYPLTTCVVSGGKLGEMGKPIDMVVGDRLFRLCCAGCKKKVAADPATYAAKLDAAVIKAESDNYALETCVVSGKKLGSMGAGPEFVVAGRLVKLCCKGCVGKFNKAPAGYIAKLDKAAKKPGKKKKKSNEKKSDHGDGHDH